MLLLIHGSIILLFLLLGILFRLGKGAVLIAGYNTAPQREKEQIDEKKLCKYMSNLMFVLAACWAIVASSEIFHKLWLVYLGLGLLLAAVFFGVIFLNTGNRIQKQDPR